MSDLRLDHRRIGFRLSGFRREPLHDSLRGLADAGYGAVEICLEHPELDPAGSPWPADKLRNVLQELNLMPAAVSFHGKNAPWAEKDDKCRSGIQLATDIGTDVFVSSSVVGDPATEFPHLVDFTIEMCEVSGAAGIRFAIEPEPGTIIGDHAALHKLMEAVDSPFLAVNLDVGHTFLTETDVSFEIVNLGAAIAHVHVEDMTRGQHRHLLPGEGDLDFKAIFSCFERIGYRGIYTIDLFDIYENPYRTAQQALQLLWKQVI